MPVIYLETKIKSTVEVCFDLSRSIDLHRISTAETNEKAIAGRTKGLIEASEFVAGKTFWHYTKAYLKNYRFQ